MNWLGLRQHVKEQVANPGLTDLQFERWQTLVMSRIHRDIKPKELVVRKVFTPTFFPWILPGKLEEIIYLTTPGSAQDTIRLQRVSRETIAQYTAVTTGKPAFYALDGLAISMYPNGLNVEYTLIYHNQDAVMSDDTDINVVLSNYPDLWVYGLLREVYMLMRDFEGAREARDTYLSEVAAINRSNAWKQAAEAPQASGAWANG